MRSFQLGTLILALAGGGSSAACTGASRTQLLQVPNELNHEFAGTEGVVVAFVDFACPYCREQSLEFEKLLRINQDAALSFYFVPSTERSLKLSEVAECAEKQGLGAEVTLALFREISASQDRAIEVAGGFGASEEELRQCVEEPSTINGLLQSVALSQRLDVTGLPTLFVREVRFDGVATAEELSASVSRSR